MDYIDTLLIMEDDLDEDEDLGEFGQSSTGQPTLTTRGRLYKKVVKVNCS